LDELGEVFDVVSRYFGLLSEPTRLRIINSICQREKSVSEIVADTGCTQTNVSRHLGAMYRAGVLGRRKHGNFIYYRVSDTTLTDICRVVCLHIASRDETGARQSSMIAVAQGLDATRGERVSNSAKRIDSTTRSVR
jgi:DNA-binding transcriptional ArsR family regulator